MESTITPERKTLDQLRAQIKGRLTLPGEAGFDEDKFAWNLVIGHAPEVIVAALDEADVRAAVRFAAEHGMPISVQSTGHGQFRASQGGMLIRTSNLKSISIDAENRSATIGAGAVWSEVIQAVAPHGLAPLSGSSPTVGVVGYLLGGGFGLLSRKYGLGVDHVRRFRVVLPDESIVDATPSDNADLFWAVCGGGGAFGVITEVEVELFPHPEIYGGALMFPGERAAEVCRAFARWTSSLIEEVSPAIILITFPPVPFVPEFLQGRSMVIVAAAMPNEEAAAEWVQPMRELGPEFDMMGPLPYTESARVYNDPVDPLPVHGRGVLLKEMDEAMIDAMMGSIGDLAQSPNLMIQVRHLGGAISSVDESASAVGDRRRAKYLLYMLGVPMPHNPPEAIVGHAEGVIAALAPWTLSRGPLNFLGEGNVTASALREVFGEDGYRRLETVKRTFDPRNLFRHAGIGICMAGE